MNDYCFDTYQKMLDSHQQQEYAFCDHTMGRSLFLLIRRIYIYLSFRKETSGLQSEVDSWFLFVCRRSSA